MGSDGHRRRYQQQQGGSRPSRGAPGARGGADPGRADPFPPRGQPLGVRVNTDLDDELGDTDVVYLLRIQSERGASDGIPANGGYARRYGLGEERMSMLKPAAVIMHPGPVNRASRSTTLSPTGSDR